MADIYLHRALHFVKLNSDGGYRYGIRGGGSVVRDSIGALIIAYSILLGDGRRLG